MFVGISQNKPLCFISASLLTPSSPSLSPSLPPLPLSLPLQGRVLTPSTEQRAMRKKEKRCLSNQICRWPQKTWEPANLAPGQLPLANLYITNQMRPPNWTTDTVLPGHAHCQRSDPSCPAHKFLNPRTRLRLKLQIFPPHDYEEAE